MCGIVGYIGGKPANEILLAGLGRLEYRGYDSAGIATLDADGAPTLTRVKGKVAQLAEKLAKTAAGDKNSLGVGHTRWATHGAPSAKNAHPHRAGEILLVHNGIIENYKELKSAYLAHNVVKSSSPRRTYRRNTSDLRASLSPSSASKSVDFKLHKFTSDTDSEVLAALIDAFYDAKTPLVAAVAAALKLVEGTYGIAVISTREPDKIVAARRGSPLIIGVGNSENRENLVASDAAALLGRTRRAIYLRDGEIAEISCDAVEIKDLNLIKLPAKIETVETDLAAIQKNGYAHFLLKEIMEQPETLAATLGGHIDARSLTVKLGGLNLSEKNLRGIRHIVIVGCGTAYYAGMLASYYLEQLVGDITVETVIASEFRYRAAHLPENSVALIVSQSGETADTLACLREIKSRGVKTLGIINAVGSTIAREVDGGIYVHAGPEISVASTKAFTSQTAAMVLFAIVLAQTRGENMLARDFAKELLELPGEIAKLLKNHAAAIAELAQKYAKYNHAIYLGRDTAYPAALEGALKLKEISYIDANAYAAGELKHGPLALISPEFFEVALVIDGRLFDKTLSNLQEVLARGGRIVALTNSNREIPAADVVRVATPLKLLTPLLLNVAQQLFAYHVACARGNDVDQPRNLAKSVTVE